MHNVGKPACAAAALAALGLALGFAFPPAAAENGTGLSASVSCGDSTAPRRILLIGRDRDHPEGTHEYMAGLEILAACLRPVEEVEVTLVNAEGDWPSGPALLDETDCAVLYLGLGADFMRETEQRWAAFQRLVERGGGLVAIHWGMGARDAESGEPFAEIVGGYHGGPDRRFRVVDARCRFADPGHPVCRGLADFDARDEFYYALKFVGNQGRPGPPDAPGLAPLLTVEIEDEDHAVAWTYERPGGGRSFGFSGGHFHWNWELPEYRRMVCQAILWCAGAEAAIPEDGLTVDVTEAKRVQGSGFRN